MNGIPDPGRASRAVMQLCMSFEEALTAAQKFEKFHDENPKVFVVLARLAREWIARTGRRDIGIGALTERARWEIALATSDPDFKINNNFRAYYARLLMHDHPDLAGIFQLRASEADAWIATYRPVAVVA